VLVAADGKMIEGLAGKYGELLPHLDERRRRLYLGSEARALGAGGVAAVARASGVPRQTVAAGAGELAAGAEPLGRARRAGGGRRRAEEKDPGLVPALLALVEDSTRGDPQSPLTWTTKSLRHLAAELTARGHRCSPDTVASLLRGQGFSLQANAKTIEGRQHPDRDGQFRYISEQARVHMAAGQPVISVDAKKKEQVGNYAQAGREWRRQGGPVEVRDHDFPDEQEGEPGKVTPYGICDVAANTGFVNLGTDHSTAAFAVESIRLWWQAAGQDAYPGASRLLITAGAGGSNGYRTRAWKTGLAALAALAAWTGLEITVCHFPPGTSKWNKIEHRLFSHITMNWRGRPLTSHEVIIQTIAATTTATGLKVTAALDAGRYPKGVKITGAQMDELKRRALTLHDWHGAWNYTLHRPAAEDPAAARPAPRPRAAWHGQAALSHPSLTGMALQDLAALAAELDTPFRARREQSLYASRGGPRRNAGWASQPCHGKLGLTSHLLATLLCQRLSLPRHVIASLFGVDRTTIGDAVRLTRELLAGHGTSIQPAPVRLRTLDDLRSYAAAAGITLPPPPNPASSADTSPVPQSATTCPQAETY
jgi:hypothetical protein